MRFKVVGDKRIGDKYVVTVGAVEPIELETREAQDSYSRNEY